MDTAVLTVRVPADVKDRLDKLADATHRSKSYLAGEAIRKYLDLEAWQIGEIDRAIREADAGDFATDEELQAVRNNAVEVLRVFHTARKWPEQLGN